MFEDASAVNGYGNLRPLSPLIAVETQLFPIVVMWDFIPNSLCYRACEDDVIEMTVTDPEVLIVGGGLAGLCCGIELQKSHIPFKCCYLLIPNVGGCLTMKH